MRTYLPGMGVFKWWMEHIGGPAWNSKCITGNEPKCFA